MLIDNAKLIQLQKPTKILNSEFGVISNHFLLVQSFIDFVSFCSILPRVPGELEQSRAFIGLRQATRWTVDQSIIILNGQVRGAHYQTVEPETVCCKANVLTMKRKRNISKPVACGPSKYNSFFWV